MEFYKDEAGKQSRRMKLVTCPAKKRSCLSVCPVCLPGEELTRWPESETTSQKAKPHSLTHPGQQATACLLGDLTGMEMEDRDRRQSARRERQIGDLVSVGKCLVAI